MEKLKQQFIAWLIKKGYTPHDSNITHLEAGYAIGAAAAIVLLFLSGCFFSLTIAVAIASIGAVVAAAIAGYLKEKRDGENFDSLDLYATAAGGVLAALQLLILVLILKLFI